MSKPFADFLHPPLTHASFFAGHPAAAEITALLGATNAHAITCPAGSEWALCQPEVRLAVMLHEPPATGPRIMLLTGAAFDAFDAFYLPSMVRYIKHALAGWIRGAEDAAGWDAMVVATRERLQRLTRSEYDARVPTHEEVVEGVREVFFRLGLTLGSDGWGDYILGARSLLADGMEAPIKTGGEIMPNDYHHRLVACVAALGWVDAPWALDPLPKTWSTGLPADPWPRAHKAIAVPRVPCPTNWPGKANHGR